ncbi:hypothetical protein [Microvirga alba]|uniref:Lipoprotein n=1 Tax=Microvirga alba TaxID=2791025 RepID=A0A931BM07_9HYPH|nr:hypothetical protein [Microvirga alba]MBF9231810.1 hypothetical protein [Microvirga alba]
MGNGLGAKAALAFAMLGLTALTGCGAPGEGGSTLGNMILFAGPTVPPPQAAQIEDVYCPPVEVSEGGSALQAYTGGRVGDTGGLRSQISISQLARECVGRPDGATVVKIGVEGRALLGVGGAAGRYDVPVHIVVKRGSTVIANRSKRLSVAIPAGDSQATFVVVEEGIVVPAVDANSFEIEVGLGAQAATGRRRR